MTTMTQTELSEGRGAVHKFSELSSGDSHPQVDWSPAISHREAHEIPSLFFLKQMIQRAPLKTISITTVAALTLGYLAGYTVRRNKSRRASK